MNFLQSYAKEIIALVVPFITWFLNARFRARAKLVWSRPHGFSFLVQQPLRDAQGQVIRPNQLVNTQSLLVSNNGRDTATKIEAVFNWKPQHLNLWPVRHYGEIVEPDNRYILTFESLAPGEQVAIEILSINVDLPPLLILRSDQSVAEEVRMVTTRFVPMWAQSLAQLVFFVGIGAMVYVVIVLVQFLVLQTPIRF